MVTQQLVLTRGNPFLVGRSESVIYSTKINLSEVDFFQPIILDGEIQSFGVQSRIVFDDGTQETIEPAINTPVISRNLFIENRDISSLLVDKTGIAEIQILGLTTTNGIPVNFLGGRLTFEKILIQPTPIEPPITEPIDDQPILIPIVPPILEQTKIFGLTLKQIAVLIGIGVLVL